MNTRQDEKEIDKYIKSYSKLNDDLLKELLESLKDTSTWGERKRNKNKIKAIETLLL